MGVTIRRADPLDGVGNKATLAAKIGIMNDQSATYMDRKDAAGFLRGAWDVLRRNPKTVDAAEYINAAVIAHRYPEDTTGGKK